MSAESDLKRHRDEAVRLRGQISKTSDTIATKRKKAADARAAATRSKSATTIKSKLREADSAERDANAAEKKRADLEKKVAEVEKKVATAQARYEKDQRNSQKKALDSVRRQNAAATRQFTPQRRLADGASTDFVPGRRLGEEFPRDGSALDIAPGNDVFLSHASEDKDEIARPLKDALEAQGVSVWFDEIKIKVGQSIRQEIGTGITHARFGVVILSPEFFAKQWTQAELDALFSKKMSSGENLILPIWHRVTKDQVNAHSPLLAGILALNSSLMTVEEIADAIVDVVRPST